MSNLTTPYTFSNSTVANATEVNANFTAIATLLNSTGLDPSGLASSSVTTAKIADAAVTQAKRAALGQQVSSACGTFTTNSSSYVDVTNLTVSITTTGRPVVITLIPDSAQTSSYINPGQNCQLKVLRDASAVGVFDIGIDSGSTLQVPVGTIHTIDVPAAATYTYKVQVQRSGAASLITVLNAKLVAYEL